MNRIKSYEQKKFFFYVFIGLLPNKERRRETLKKSFFLIWKKYINKICQTFVAGTGFIVKGFIYCFVPVYCDDIKKVK